MRELQKQRVQTTLLIHLWERTKNGKLVSIGKEGNLLEEEPCQPLKAKRKNPRREINDTGERERENQRS